MLKNMDGLNISLLVKFLKRFIFALSLFFLFDCSNYSTYKPKPIPPILLSLKAIPTGHLLTFRATNPEAFFFGYRLYLGGTEAEVRNPSSLNQGIDCASINLLPNLPLEYSIEISPNTGGLAPVEAGDNPNRVCKIITNLQTGNFIVLRAMTISLQLGSNNLNFSAPSNALIVP